MKFSKKLTFAILIFATIFFAYCSKRKKNIPENIDCSNAQVCVGNLTHDTIFYDWNSNGLTDTLLPGKSTCLQVGSVKKIYDRKTGKLVDDKSVTVSINSNFGNWALKVETCSKKSNFEYDINNPSNGLIFLYAE